MAYSSLEPLDEDVGISRPKLVSNFAALETYLGYDHGSLDANNGNSALHNKISFVQQAADPVTQTGKIRVFAKDDGAGTDELFLLRADDATLIQLTVDSGNPVSASPGQTYLPGGIIMKWGTDGIISALGGTAINFAVPFPNNCFSVQLTPLDINATSYVTVPIKDVNHFNARASNSIQVMWVAIGN